MPPTRLVQPRGFGIGGGGGGSAGNVDSGGYSGPGQGGGGGAAPGALDSLLEGAGNLLTDTISNALGNVGGALLADLLIKAGLPPNIVNVLTGQAQNILGTSEQGGGVPFVGNVLQGLIQPNLRGPDPGGIGGGILSFVQTAGLSGKVAGELLKSKKIQLNQLLTGGQKSVISQVYAAALR